MRIMIETSAPLSATDFQILSLLLERFDSEPPAEGSKAPKITETAKAPAKAPAKTKAPAAKAPAKTKAPAAKAPANTNASGFSLDTEKLAEEVAPAAAEEPEETVPEPAAEETVPETAAESAQADQDQPVTEQTMDAAVAEAKKLMQGGDKAKVREALGAAGVAKVGAIETEGQGAAFLAALKG